MQRHFLPSIKNWLHKKDACKQNKLHRRDARERKYDTEGRHLVAKSLKQMALSMIIVRGSKSGSKQAQGKKLWSIGTFTLFFVRSTKQLEGFVCFINPYLEFSSVSKWTDKQESSLSRMCPYNLVCFNGLELNLGGSHCRGWRVAFDRRSRDVRRVVVVAPTFAVALALWCRVAVAEFHRDASCKNRGHVVQSVHTFYLLLLTLLYLS